MSHYVNPDFNINRVVENDFSPSALKPKMVLTL